MVYHFGVPHPTVKKIFRMQKRIVRIMMGCRKEVSCKNLFRKLKILHLMPQYILSLMMFIIKNKNQFTVNSEVHNINTIQHTNLHQPTSDLTGYHYIIFYQMFLLDSYYTSVYSFTKLL